MTPIVLAQSLAEYGVMAAITDKVTRTALEFSIRTNSEIVYTLNAPTRNLQLPAESRPIGSDLLGSCPLHPI